MDIRESEQQLRDLDLGTGFDLIFGILRAYGFPKNSITRLRSGSLNVATRQNEVLWKNRLWFRHVDSGEDIHIVIDDAQRDAEIFAKRPRFLVVTNADHLVAQDTKKRQTLDIPLHELAANVAFFWAWTGVERTPVVEASRAADVKAAQRMAKLYDEVRLLNDIESDDDVEQLNVFFCQLLFCFFAEDTGVFPKASFTDAVVDLTQSDGSDTQDFLTRLFKVLNTPEHERRDLPEYFRSFGYVNGDLFAHRSLVPKFSARARGIVIESSDLDWSQINPDIFGSMMQAVVRSDDREALGMHYTSEENIMKVLNPLFLDELNEEFDQAAESVSRLDKLRDRIASIKVFDPACGSGNFLVVAYKELRRLENRILQRKYDLEGYEAGALFSQDSLIKLDHFYGIEIEDFAVDVARLSLWLAKHQMNIEFRELFSVDVSLIPLTDSGQIRCANATRFDWEEACSAADDEEVYVCGNPPYLGSSMQKPMHKADFVQFFGTASYAKNLDYISLWFLSATKYVKNEKRVAAFVTTNSVCQGDHVALMWPHIFDSGIEIGFAHQSFRWTNSAAGQAGVTCNIVALRRKSSRKKQLYSGNSVRTVENIGPYLLPTSTNVIVFRRNRSLFDLPPMVFGSKATDGGGLVLSSAERDQLLQSAPEVASFVKRYAGAEDVLHGKVRYCLWIPDGEADMAKSVPLLAERFKRVSAMRAAGSAPAKALADKPHRFLQRAYKATDAVAVPRTTSERREYLPLDLVGPDFVLSSDAFAIYNAEPWLFGLIQSRMHMVWTRAIAGRLESRIRYSATLVYNTFPVPELTVAEKQALAKAARFVLRTREQFFDMTLAQMYDPDAMSGLLRQAHQRLDESVDRIYKRTGFASDEERLTLLFEMYATAIEREGA